MYKKLISSLAIVTVIAIAFLINSCQLSPIAPPGTQNSPRDDAGNGCDSANVFCGSPGTIQIQNPCPGDVTTIDLWAGVGNVSAGALVGHVNLTFVSGNTWHVEYVITNPDFEVTEAHFDIECALEDIPQTHNGNPRPGQFEYKTKTAPWEFDFTLPAGCSCFYVAAHAKGILGGHTCFNASIPPGCVNINNIHHDGPGGCYWSFDLSNAGSFNGTWCGWCMDLGTDIESPNFNCAHLFSSLEPFPEYLKPYIEGWMDMDKINYLINHFAVGDTVQRMNYLCQPVGGLGIINAFDYQKAIWRILDLGPGSTYSELSDSLVVNAIYCDVWQNGEGFEPSCANGDYIAFIIDPGIDPATGRQAQPLFAAAPCCGTSSEQTAWGDGKYGGQFPGPNWATYFIWCPTCP